VKVLAIIGSPRKGETYQAVRMVEEQMKQIGRVDFQYLFLKDVHLGQCLGCHACILSGEDRCPLKDDRASLEQQMMDSDGVIFASPVYSLQVTALMKNFLDHFSYLFHRPRFFGKKAMALATGGGRFKDTLNYLELNARAWGFDPAAKLGVPHYDGLTPEYRRRTAQAIADAARRLYASIKANRLPSPRLRELIRFRMWKYTVLAYGNKCDGKYWRDRGWLDKDYYYDSKIGLPKLLCANAIDRLGRHFMKRVFVEEQEHVEP